MSEDHEVIYLEPECCADPDLGRTWCQDVPWDCEDGAHPALGEPQEEDNCDR